MFYDSNFKKSIILMHKEYIKNKQPVKIFINIIKKCLVYHALHFIVG